MYRQQQHSSPSAHNQRDGHRMMGDRKDDVWRNYGETSNCNKPYRGSGGTLGNRHHFAPREPRHALRQQQPRAKRSDNWRNYGGSNSQQLFTDGQEQEQRQRQKQEQGPRQREKQELGLGLGLGLAATRRCQMKPSFAMLQQQSAMAQALLPHWVRMKDMLWLSTLKQNSSKDASTMTSATGMPMNSKKSFSAAPQPQPVTTLTARIIARDGPLGPSSTIELMPVPRGRRDSTPLDTCCVNLIFESFGMIGITPNPQNADVYDIKRSADCALTAEQKQRLRNAIERTADGQVLDALQAAIQQIRTEIEQIEPDIGPRDAACRPELIKQQPEQEEAVFDPAVWTWRTPTPTTASPISEHSSDNNSDSDSSHNLSTQQRTSNTEGVCQRRHSTNSTSGDARSQADLPVIRRSPFDFRQPPFVRQAKPQPM